MVAYGDLGGSCSASLLRNDWAVTAAHCVEVKDAKGSSVPDPARPGQNRLKPQAGMQITAAWDGPQNRKVVRVETFRPYDVALLKLDSPLRVHGLVKGYSRLVFQDGQFPYFGEPVGAALLVFGKGRNVLATGSGESATPSSSDGKFRMGYARATRDEDTRYWYPSNSTEMVAGGDSGGPSFSWVLEGYALVGVHSSTLTEYVPGKPTTDWTWVNKIIEAGDAPLGPVWRRMYDVMGPPPAGDPEPALEPPPPGFVGTFAATPPDYQPLWLYAVRPNGDLMWYRKEARSSAWQGPKKVGTGWSGFKDMIAAGGNSLYVLTADDRLMWYQHDGFNDGAFRWNPLNAHGGVEVGHGWKFKKIFSGGEGIVYAITADGTLMWYRHNGYMDGNGAAWEVPKEIGKGYQPSTVLGGPPQSRGWGIYRDVFSTGSGHVYTVKTDGTLWLHQQKNYATGGDTWYPPKQIAAGWGNFQQIIPTSDDVILAIQKDGQLVWHKWSAAPPTVAIARVKMRWEGPVTLGTGWQDFGKVVALMPVAHPTGPR